MNSLKKLSAQCDGPLGGILREVSYLLEVKLVDVVREEDYGIFVCREEAGNGGDASTDFLDEDSRVISR